MKLGCGRGKLGQQGMRYTRGLAVWLCVDATAHWSLPPSRLIHQPGLSCELPTLQTTLIRTAVPRPHNCCPIIHTARFGVDYRSACSIDLNALLSRLDYSSNGPRFYDAYIMQVCSVLCWQRLL